MTALPNYPNVHAIRSRRVKITADNSIFAPLAKDPARQLELAEAERIIASTATQCGMIENAGAPAWQFRDGNGRIIRKADALPAIKPQAEIDDEIRVFSPAAYVCMTAAVAVVVAVMAAFDWLVGALP